MATFGTFTSAVLTAAELNTAGGAWTAYTPTMTAWTTGTGTLTGAYEQVGRTTHVRIVLTLGGTSTMVGWPTFSLPNTLNTTAIEGNVLAVDTSAGLNYLGVLLRASSTTVGPGYGGTAGVTVFYAATVPFTWATTDILTLLLTYEATADGT